MMRSNQTGETYYYRALHLPGFTIRVNKFVFL